MPVSDSTILWAFVPPVHEFSLHLFTASCFQTTRILSCTILTNIRRNDQIKHLGRRWEFSLYGTLWNITVYSVKGNSSGTSACWVYFFAHLIAHQTLTSFQNPHWCSRVGPINIKEKKRKKKLGRIEGEREKAMELLMTTNSACTTSSKPTIYFPLSWPCLSTMATFSKRSEERIVSEKLPLAQCVVLILRSPQHFHSLHGCTPH